MKENTFPLFTQKALAERWGVSKQVVHAWSRRKQDFCRPSLDLVKGDGPYYPFYEVLRYEEHLKKKALKKLGITENEQA